MHSARWIPVVVARGHLTGRQLRLEVSKLATSVRSSALYTLGGVWAMRGGENSQRAPKGFFSVSAAAQSDYCARSAWAVAEIAVCVGQLR